MRSDTPTTDTATPPARATHALIPIGIDPDHPSSAPALFGAPPLMGHDPVKVYTAAASWFEATADQLAPEVTPRWSPNLLFAAVYALGTAMLEGLPAGATPVIMNVAWFYLGNAFGPARAEHDRCADHIVPEDITDPEMSRESIRHRLRFVAEDLRFRADLMRAAAPPPAGDAEPAPVAATTEGDRS